MDAPWKPRCSQISTAPAGFRRRRTRRACWPRCVKGVTKLEVAGYTASAYVLHPTDWEGVERALSSTNAVEHLSLPYDPATRRLLGVPVTTSNARAAGVGHVIATDAVALDTDTRGVDVQWSENAAADSFGKNLVFARCESRYATSVFSPLGVVSLDLTP